MPHIVHHGGWLLALALHATPLRAHDFWIEASDYRPADATPVTLTLREGQHGRGNSIPYIDHWFTDFVQVDARGRRPVTSLMGNDPAARLVPARGATLIGYQSTRNFVSTTPDVFRNYLHEEGLEHVSALRRARKEEGWEAHEYFVRCAKALLDNTPAREDTYAQALGFTLEIIPEADPYGLKPGGELPVRLLYRGAPLPGALVAAFTRERPEAIVRARTDGDGRTRLRLAHGGNWLVKGVWIVPLEGDSRAKWESFWASLTFDLR